MSPSYAMNIASLREAYISQALTPASVVEQCLQRIRAQSSANAWIRVLSLEELSPYLNALEDKAIEDYPLWGIPFAIKDNIDLAGIETTAGCPDYAYTPTEHAFVVEQLIKAGAIPLGKTNLDQFATGLVGTRSPFGAVSNAFNEEYISGGSSSGSSFAVATGQVSFSLGTDTAGSGRVPAAFHNLIGTKPSRGLFSCRGVVPACRSLDCVTLFTTTQSDANQLLEIASVYDEKDSYSRKPLFSSPLMGAEFSVGIPKADQLEFFDNTEYAGLFQQACEQFAACGARIVELDISPFLDAATFLYQGPWVAERYHAVGEFIDQSSICADATVASIIRGGKNLGAVETFDGLYKMQAFKKAADALLDSVDVILVPTTTDHYTIEAMNNNPIELNSRLGYYTNFMNLLDYSALAIPAGFTSEALPFGVTLFAGALEDKKLQTLSARYLAVKQWGMGATGLAMPAPEATNDTTGAIKVAVCGAHLQGMPLNTQLVERASVFLEATTTSPNYQFYALAGGPPLRPGLRRADEGEQGESIYVEVWAVPEADFGSFVAGIPAPLGIGKLELASGEWVSGFICEPYGLAGARDITHLKDWRAYIASLD